MAGGGLMITVDDADTVVLAAEVAVTETVKAAETEEGAL
jgi:hypothetical protein